MINTTRDLIKEQIKKFYAEILFVKFIFSFVNCLSLYFVVHVLESIATEETTSTEVYMKLGEMILALFTPYLTLVSQGFLFPKSRTLNTLRHFLLRYRLTEEEKKLVYEK
jgi:hypothetical protein